MAALFSRRSLEIAANAGTVLVCIALFWQIGASYLRQPSQPSRPDVGYKVGDRLPDTSALRWSGPKRTVLVMTASTCKFCTTSMSFYKRVAASARNTDVRFVGVTSEDLTTNRSYWSSNGVSPDDVISSRDAKLPIRGTPTLIVADGQGTVIGVWPGAVSAGEEARVIAAMEAK